MENGLSKLFNFWGHTIDVSDQEVFTLKYSGLHDEEGNKTNVRDPLIVGQRLSGSFLSFMIMVHPYKDDTNCKHSPMNCRDCIKLTWYVYGIDYSIGTQMMKIPHDLLAQLEALDNGRNTDIDTPKKGRGDISSECCAGHFKTKFLRYVNEVLFEMV